MFVPADFVETDLAWLDRLLARDAFVTVVTTGSDGLPQVTLLPVVYQRDGEDILIEGHWARPNPQAGHAGPALVLVHGPHGYVSPGWYPDNAARSGVEQPKAGPQDEPQGGGEYKQGAARVPTWNYAAAELRGTLEPVTDPEALIDMLDPAADRAAPAAHARRHHRFPFPRPAGTDQAQAQPEPSRGQPARRDRRAVGARFPTFA
jgi:transcriptional regulator